MMMMMTMTSTVFYPTVTLSNLNQFL